ncbi:hypothetical protein N8D74_07160 [Curtobacterium flaccumfaciens]|uniref:Uncharacterized protein n=1 Tax=Curtobacterium poinsettiae TaxID=159612 RepID=A0A9Q9P899_9MICO|nr:hypothetical protein [Curtobacterium flaccumfaciens]UXN26651.1 hypothetical protein N8D74_07160 [Curtobacterium flaccumfaciens]UYC81493.1 hypothetical protein OE229_03245 [Curtobacterium flaccumfaciens pv. poinsettiae]
MTNDMRPEAAAAVRSELAAIGTGRSALQRQQRRARIAISVASVAAVALTTSAAALVAAGLPGTTTTAAVGHTTTATHTGPARIDIGAAPDDAGAVIVDITCRNDVGMVQVPTVGGGASGLSCRDEGTMRVVDGRLPKDGTTTFSIEASTGTTWTATLQYATAVTSEWGVNDKGQTYGVPNASGHPDLVPGTADNGREGWVLWSEPDGGNVYESDGTTVVGHWTAGVADEVPLDQRYVDDLNGVQTATPSPGSPR